MTYSICATDGTCHGVAIATKAPTVGSLAPFVSRNGALSTQASVSIPLGVRTKRLLDRGCGVEEAASTLVARDEGANERQLHGVDRWGGSVIHSGTDCVEWFGGREGEGYTVAGNMLTGEAVVDAIVEGFEGGEGPLRERLLDALEAGEDAGGDKRAELAQSAALRVYSPEPSLADDLRVDDDDDPVRELRRLHGVALDQHEEWREENPVMDLQRVPPLG
ncbi:DUF1028 domain-containing protein [Natronorarus salvus]|uniref:DUF1028 domain-containing protein n=1 Tax=Natronorarus salvus TaxID=3117733 RepID=UPI002F263644